MLEITDLRVGYRPQVDVLHDVSVTVNDKDFVAILGSNGAGKSTLARSISGVLRPRAGTVVWQGKFLPHDPEKVARLGIAHVPEARGVFASLTVSENLRLGAYWLRDRAEVRRRFAGVHELFPVLAEKAEQHAGTLSGGQRQMLAIGRGLMARPQLLIVDEPSLGLAPKLVEDVMETLRDLNQTGVAVLLIEQNAIALDFCTRACVLRSGHVVVEGTAAALAGSETLRESYL